MAFSQHLDALWITGAGLKKDANPVDAIRALKLAGDDPCREDLQGRRRLSPMSQRVSMSRVAIIKLFPVHRVG